MAKKLKFVGLQRVLKKLNKETSKIRGRSTKGLWLGALKIKKTSVELTPIQTGNLRRSAYCRVFFKTNHTVEIGYSAVEYAMWVHEIPAQHRVGQWKFLETAIKQETNAVLDLVKKHAKIG